jgi:hypothetical protein
MEQSCAPGRRTFMPALSNVLSTVLPRGIARSRLSATGWVALAASLGAGACAYAGLYPRFDDGQLRVVLALTSVGFGAAVAAYAARARTAGAAVGRALGMAVVLGVASTVLPSAILSHGSGSFFVFMLFGVVFGGVTGLLYGIPLALLAGCTQRDVASPSAAGADRAVRNAGLWLAIVATLAVVGASGLDERAAGAAPMAVSVAIALAGLFAMARACVRLARRDAFLARVRDGHEPRLRLRVIDARDDLREVPCLGEGETVVEWLAEDADTTTAYRAAAVGVPVAIVGVPPRPGAR